MGKGLIVLRIIHFYRMSRFRLDQSKSSNPSSRERLEYGGDRGKISCVK